jgi:hypothetical protein
MMSTGVRNTVVVLMNERTPASVTSRKGAATASNAESEFDYPVVAGTG